MAIHESEPDRKTLTEEDGSQQEYDYVEVIYLRDVDEPAYMVATSQVSAFDEYLAIRLDDPGSTHGKEVHKFPHDQIEVRKTILKPVDESMSVGPLVEGSEVPK